MLTGFGSGLLPVLLANPEIGFETTAPTATVKYGQQTQDKMFNGYVFFTDANERLGLEVDAKSGRVRGK
jgi:hypothetical protein